VLLLLLLLFLFEGEEEEEEEVSVLLGLLRGLLTLPDTFRTILLLDKVPLLSVVSVCVSVSDL